MKKNLLISFVVAALLALGWWLALTDAGRNLWDRTPRNFVSVEYGIAFSYPRAFDFAEHDIVVEDIPLHVITLLPADAELPENGEGSPGVSVIIGNVDGATTLAEWVNRFQSAIGGPSFDFAEGTLAGAPALLYTSTGLYEADNIAVKNDGNIYIISASWLTRGDMTLGALDDIALTFRFTAAQEP